MLKVQKVKSTKTGWRGTCKAEMQIYAKTAHDIDMVSGVEPNSILILWDICPWEYGFPWMCQVFRSHIRRHIYIWEHGFPSYDDESLCKLINTLDLNGEKSRLKTILSEINKLLRGSIEQTL